VRKAVTIAVVEAGATLLDYIDHQFDPQGITALALLAESHISVHTWPEHGRYAADVFTCGDCDAAAGADALMAMLGVGEVTRVDR